MLAKIVSSALIGIDGYTVTVEVDISSGLPRYDIVGLPDSSVKESKERVRTAIKNSGFEFPVKVITINLSPAHTKKEGPSFDLPIAVGMLAASGIINKNLVQDVFISGELSLDGTVLPVNGVLPMVHHMKKCGIKECIVPYENVYEAGLVTGMSVYGVKNLKELIAHFRGDKLEPVSVDIRELFKSDLPFELDFSDIKGQESIKRAIEIAVCGAHNLLMIGPPGSGKTMMANRVPTIMPDMNFFESVEVTKVYSVAGLLHNKNSLVIKRPFRAPHHTISYSALTGGGRVPKPGEISLAHNGVLFLDELPEFQKNSLEVMRQPLEDGSVTISRVNGTVTYPSNFMLLASMNPCPCGYLFKNGGGQKCKCTQNEINRYLGKISGPLLDRIDIHVEVPVVKYEELSSTKKNEETSLIIKKRVIETLEIQKQRFKNTNVRFNANMSAKDIENFCPLDESGKQILKKAFDVMNLSGRAYHKILKVARTIADMEKSENIMTNHLTEAIMYRSLDRKYFNS